MNTKAKKENFMKYLFPYQPGTHQRLISNFFAEIYQNFHKRSENLFDTYTFQELIQIPMIVSDKLYNVFIGTDPKMEVKHFSNGLYTLLFGNMDEKIAIVFGLLDFDNDYKITYEDTFLILAHFHLIDNTTETIGLLEKVIMNYFEHKDRLDRYNCIDIKKNTDILLLVLLYINKYLDIISDAELFQYETSTKKGKGDKNIKNTIYPDFFTAEDYEDCEYKPSPLLFNYLEAIDFGKKKKKNFDVEEDDSDEESESDDEDLDALCDFAMDFQELRDRFIGQCTYEPRLLTSTFSCSFFQDERTKMKEQKKEDSVKQLDEILMNQSYKRMRFKEKKKNEIKEMDSDKKHEKLDKSGDNISVENNNTGATSKNLDNGGGFGGGLRRARTNFFGFKRANTKMLSKYEIILFKKKNSEKKQVKLVLVGKYIFYYNCVGVSKKSFLFKKIMPISSLFLRKPKKENGVIVFSLVSFLHNIEKEKIFFCEKVDEANKFYNKFNKNKLYRDVKKYYYFKYEVGAGKFGHVFYAHRNSDGKPLAVKLVQKGTQSLEEYKINRWEIDIFKMLTNLRHPNVIQCIDMFENDSQIFFVYEYIPDGDLKKYARDLKLNPSYYTLDVILKLSMQMIEGIRILHRYGVIHRDIKTTNMMVEINSPIVKKSQNNSSGGQLIHTDLADSTVKIIDFGLSRILGKYEKSCDPYGSLCFKAPELIKHENYSFKVDVWAIGVTIYYLVYRELPFEKGTKDDIKRDIISAMVPFYSNNFITDQTRYIEDTSKIDNINNFQMKSNLLYSLLCDCLEKKEDRRPSIDQLSKRYTSVIKNIH